MKLGNYIHQLLKENETVIVPGFGPFVSSYKPPEINEETSQVNPTSKKITFHSFIRNNDGLLVNFVAENESISHFDALRRIEKEREKIRYRLDKGEKVILKNTGVLYFNNIHEIEFEPYAEENLLLDSYGLDASPIIVENRVSEPSGNNQKNDETNVIQNKPEQERKSRGWLLILIVLVPLVAAGYYILNKNNAPPVIVNEIPDTTKTTFENRVLATDTAQSGQLPVTTADSAEIEIVAADTVASDTTITAKYILVGGSFKDQENAEKFLQKIKLEGFEPFHLGKRGNFYIIGIGQYNTIGDAARAKHQFLAKNPDSGVWVMEQE